MLGFFYEHLSEENLLKISASFVLLACVWAARYVACSVAKRRVHDLGRFHEFRRRFGYLSTFLSAIALGLIWIKALGALATFLGLVSAGLAIALHDAVANMAGWLFIVGRRPFKVGDRIEIGSVAGDVIDIRLFQFSMVEIRNWVDADQSTGRIIHVPNSKVLREPLANYETGFEYVWHEIPVLVTFESNWQKAKDILTGIVNEKGEGLSAGVEEQVRRAAMRYLVYFRHLTPIVYTSVRESGVLLTLRYVVKPRERRGSEQDMWEAVLLEFTRHDDIELAYPTRRMYRRDVEGARAAECPIPNRELPTDDG